MSLEEVEDADAEGLKVALEKSLEKSSLTKDRKFQEIGMCTDGAPVNVHIHGLVKLVKDELGNHHQLILCPAHKLELIRHDAFKTVPLNTECENDSVNIYYFFKRTNLNKRQVDQVSCWLEHQVDVLDSSIKNLPTFLGFANQQTSNTYNQQMKDCKDKLQGLLTDNSDIKKIVFYTIKVDILSLLRPVSKILQESNLLLPQLITVCSSAIKTVKKMKKLDKTHQDPFINPEFFLTFNKFIE